MIDRTAIPAVLIATALVVPTRLSAQCPRETNNGTRTTRHSIDLSAAPKLTIKSFKFEGQTGLTPIEQADIVEAIRDKMGDYEPEWIEEFGERLRDAWQERGYSEAKIIKIKALLLSETPSEKTFKVMANIESGQRYRLGKIDFVGSTQFSSAQMRALFPIRDGDLFNTHLIGDGFDGLRKIYGERGFINFSPVPQTSLDEGHGFVNLSVELDEGKQFRISATYILGLEENAAKALLRNTGLEPGNVADPESVRKFDEQHDSQGDRFLDEKRSAVCIEITLPDADQSSSPPPPQN